MLPGPVLEEQTLAYVKVAVTKSTDFQGRTEEFSNVYTFDAPTLDEPALTALADAVVALEKPLHSNRVNFVRAQVWDTGVLPNYMRVSKQLQGAGSAAGVAIYPECAWRVYWPLPRKFGVFRTVHRQLQKYLHSTCVQFGGDTEGRSKTVQPSAPSAAFNYLNNMLQPIPDHYLISPDGTRPTGPGLVAPYLEHRQFPRGRKRT